MRPPGAPEETLLHAWGTVSPGRAPRYDVYEFEVPAGAKRVTARLRYRKEHVCQLFLSLFDASGTYRGTRMDPAAAGDMDVELAVGERAAGWGGVPGPLPAGRWLALVDVERTTEEHDYSLQITAGYAEPEGEETREPAAPEAADIPGEGWYRGELHAHSLHSDGRTPVAEQVETAQSVGLDFLALTDHFTSAGWRELRPPEGRHLALLRGIELTGHAGHANLHGLDGWVSPFVDGPAHDGDGASARVGPDGGSWDINAAARAVRRRGGLFCINHPFAGDLGWRYHDFDWDLADMMEVYHRQEGAHNALQLGLWDEQLRRGRRVVGVAGTDSHHPRQGSHALGRCATCVHASELTESGIIEGLRAGRAYVSLGPDLEFRAEGPSGEARMGEELPAKESLRLHVGLHNLRYPARLYLLKNGLFQENAEVWPGDAQLEFRDRPERPGYYRLELYAAAPQEVRGERRPEMLLLLSNPIFVV